MSQMRGIVVLTSPHSQVTRISKELAAELDLKVIIQESALEDAVNLVRGLLKRREEFIWAIVSRGATLEMMKREILDVPLISIDTTDYDLMLTLHQASQLGERIGLMISDVPKLEASQQVNGIMKLSTQTYFYTNWNEFNLQTEKIKTDGIEVLVGGGESGAQVAEKIGIWHVPLLPSVQTVYQALVRAKDIVETKGREQEKAEQLKAILHYSHEGIMAMDQNERITVFNSVASKLFGLDAAKMIGRPLSDFSYKKSLTEMFDGPEEQLGFIHQIRDATLLVNKVPLTFKSRSDGILVTFKDVTKIQEEESKVRREMYARGFVAKFTFDEIRHVSNKMSGIIAKAKKFADTESTVLIRGESGVGKELIAQSMHNSHKVRRNRPFVAVNCASLDDNLLNSELFGYEEGAFTGARKGGKPGLFELAHGGTIFLDEIGKIKPEVQANLLRVLQEKEVRRIGSARVIPIDLRVIAASNENLEELISKGAFAEDLYYRLNVLTITIPPLRERREDIPELAQWMLDRFCAKYHKDMITLPPLVVKRLSTLPWPGNIRQLEHVIERCVVLADTEEDAPRILLDLVEEEFEQTQGGATHLARENEVRVKLGTLEEMETEIVQKMALSVPLTKSELALKLGISRPTLLKILKKEE
ncbi:MAG: sigma 54-interacting transcriptional regulator [Peptococcaceae bacterium]|jgi:PAS domain S-box-containing protein|nr:sigma 54-interacting transcriptional regulator [Peptococcaceae bacterium]